MPVLCDWCHWDPAIIAIRFQGPLLWAGVFWNLIVYFYSRAKKDFILIYAHLWLCTIRVFRGGGGGGVYDATWTGDKNREEWISSRTQPALRGEAAGCNLVFTCVRCWSNTSERFTVLQHYLFHAVLSKIHFFYEWKVNTKTVCDLLLRRVLDVRRTRVGRTRALY